MNNTVSVCISVLHSGRKATAAASKSATKSKKRTKVVAKKKKKLSILQRLNLQTFKAQGTNQNTSNHFAEIVLAYDVLVNAGYTIDFVSPKGGSIPLAYINTSDAIHKKFLYNQDFMFKLKHSFEYQSYRIF